MSPLGAFIAAASTIIESDIVLALNASVVLRAMNYDPNALTIEILAPTNTAYTDNLTAATISPNRIMIAPSVAGSPSEYQGVYYDFGGAAYGFGSSGTAFPIGEDGFISSAHVTGLDNNTVALIERAGGGGGAAETLVIEFDGTDWSTLATDSFPDPLQTPNAIAGLSSTLFVYIVSSTGGLTIVNRAGSALSIGGTSLIQDFAAITALRPGMIAAIYRPLADDTKLYLQAFNVTTSTVTAEGSARLIATGADATTDVSIAAASGSAVVISVGDAFDRISLCLFNGSSWTEADAIESEPFQALTCLSYQVWEYDPSMEVFSGNVVIPNNGAAAGGTSVAVTGTGFSASTAIQFDGVAATGLTLVNSRVITCTTPAGSGVADVAIIDGTTITLTNAFTYNVVSVVVTSITPNTGTSAGGTSVTITGSGFGTNMSVTFVTLVPLEIANATSVVVVNSTTITCTTPAWSGPALVSISAEDNDTLQSGSLANAYTYT